MKFLIIGSAISAALMGTRFMQQMAEGGEGAADTNGKATIRPNLEGYQNAKSASGSKSKICGDEISLTLAGATLYETYGFVSKVVNIEEFELRAKYGQRNVGQQRMFLGNLIRGGIASKDAEKSARIKAAFSADASGLRGVVAVRVKADAEAKAGEKAKLKEARDAEKSAAKTKKDQAAADKKANAQLAKDNKVEAKATASAKVVAPKGPAVVPAKQ